MNLKQLKNPSILMNPNEDLDAYCYRMSQIKDEFDCTWEDVKEYLNQELNKDLCADSYRKKAKKFSLQANDCDSDTVSELMIERFKLADERNQISACYRRISREDSIKEIAKYAADAISENVPLLPHSSLNTSGDKEAILQISDWHYGLVIDSYFNQFNTDIAKQRIAKLTAEAIELIKNNNIHKLYVVNLGDLICGRIHAQLRMLSRIDTITQIIEVSELLAQSINELSHYATIDYYDTLDNHSRVEPNIKDSLELESLARITKWYLKTRFEQHANIIINDNVFADDICSFKVLNYNVIGVHGHKDKPEKVIDSLTTLTKQHYDLVLTAHLHHFNCDEKNETVLISNSSLMGTDQYSQNLRLNSNPSQNFIIVSNNSPCESIHRILL